jgi:signal transduction histidine kinase/ligand-binding sensor domain-containing protein/class 3 adenylate cyclase/FixJ family two-component response regulator
MLLDLSNSPIVQEKIRNIQLYGGIIVLFWVLGCTLQNSDEQSNVHILTRVKAMPYVVPKDSVKSPKKVKVSISASSIVKAGAPKAIPTDLNVFPAGQLQSISANKVALIKNRPGSGGFAKPKFFTAKGIKVPVGIPEVVLAKDRGSKDQNPFNFSVFGKLQGLKHNLINCITQDSKGNLWFGSFGGGVTKYDGKYFTHFTEKEGLSSNYIICMLEDKNENLWFGTDGGGLTKYDGKTFEHYAQEDGLMSNTISCLAEDSKGNLWIGSNDNGVAMFDGKQFIHYGSKQGLASDQILCIYSDRQDNLWLGTFNGGIIKFDGTSFLQFSPQEDSLLQEVSSIAEDKHGKIWLGTKLGSLMYDGKKFYRFASRKNIMHTPISCASVGKDDNIWFGTLENGAIKYDGKNLTHFTTEEGLNVNGIRCIFEDKGGNTWLGTDGGGVSRYNGNIFTHLTEREGLSNNEVFSTIKDRKNALWFGTSGGGVSKFDNHFFYHYNDTVGLSDNFIYSILQDKSGSLWFGTNGNGAFKFDGKNFTHFSAENGLSSNQVLSIIEDKEGNLWFGTRDGGATKYNGQYFTHFTEKEGLSSNTVFSILEDTKGNLWFGTDGGGVTQFDGQHFTHFLPENGLSHKDVASIIQDKKGNLWFGTLGGGLNRFDGQYFTHFTEKEGLGNDAVLSLLQDRKGNIWIGTRFGLSKMSKATQTALSTQPVFKLTPSTVLFKNYSYEDGFLGIGCWRNSMVEAQNGDIYIGANDRLTVYHPSGERTRNSKPYLSLMGISLYNENISWPDLLHQQDSSFVLGNGVRVGDFHFSGLSPWNHLPQNLSLKHNNNNLSFTFVGVTHQQPEKVKYQYKLEGFDASWSLLSAKNEAPYGNLPSGEYTFRVKARSSTGVWSDEQTYSFSIRPPWWKTWWMYLIYTALLGGILYWLWRKEQQRQTQQLLLERQKTEQEQKVNEQLRKVDALKDQFLANTSHELRTPLQGIIGLSESLIERVQDSEQQEDLSMIISSSRRLNSLVNDILDFSKLKNQEIELALKPVNLYALTDVVLRTLSPLVKGKKFSIRNSIPKEFPAALADENRLQQILYNLLGNALKFTETGFIAVNAELEHELIVLSVEDTGIGIPKEKQELIFKEFEQGDGSIARSFAGTGLGLAVSKSLVELHGGKIWLKSEPGKGSTFFFSLPIASTDGVAPEVAAQHQQLTPLAGINTWETTFNGIEQSGSTANQTTYSDSEKVHILVVDDEVVNQQVLKNFLDKKIYRLTQALSGEEALQAINQDDSIDLVLLDVMMPRMSGYEVCQKIREKYLPSELPVLMITAKNQVSDLITGLNTGANDYIAKPFSKDEFLARLSTHLNLHKINQASNRFVPNEFIRALGYESIVGVRLGDHVEQIVTVLFADIRDYTSLSESMSPEENFKFVAAYNQRIGPLVQQHRGFVNQYLGDGIMAIFTGLPDDALRAAIAIQKELDQYNELRLSKGRKKIDVGIGLHTGSLIMGIIGDQKRMDAATISDTVNTASRMEGLTKFYGTRILLSEYSLEMLAHKSTFNFRHLGKVQVKGKKIFTDIYECIDGDAATSFEYKKQTLEVFEQGLLAYFQKSFDQTIRDLNQVLAINPKDLTAQWFLEKAKGYRSLGTPEDWEGIEFMKEK